MKNTAEGLRIEAEGLRSKPVDERKLACKLGLQGCGEEEQHRGIAYRGRRIAFQDCGRKEARLQARSTRLRRRRTAPKDCEKSEGIPERHRIPCKKKATPTLVSLCLCEK